VNYNKYLPQLKIVLYIILAARFFIDVCGDWNAGRALPDKIVWPQNKHWDKQINPDDKDIARTSYYFLQTGKFLTNNNFDRPKFRTESLWPTAFRNRYYVFYHAVLIKIYEHFNGPITLDSESNLPDKYFTIDSIIFFFFKWLFTLIALYYLYRASLLFFNEFTSRVVQLVYLLYPSAFYLFPMNSFDGVAVALTTIVVCRVLLLVVQKEITLKQIILLGLFSSFTFMVKFQALAVMFSAYLVAALYGILKKRWNLAFAFAGVMFMHLIVFIPLWISTARTVGHPVFDTQFGFAWYEGNNPTAKGSWSLGWETSDTALITMLSKEKANLSADEYTESSTYKRLAIDWIKSHPKREAVLIVRKFLIYFSPYNFMNWHFNLITFLVQLGFILFTVIMFINFRRFDLKYWIVLASGWSIVAFNIFFLVDYRWRNYVEPEMLIAAFIAYKLLYDKYCLSFKIGSGK
jgi:hypothetical protein